jgi:hypothetical protein
MAKKQFYLGPSMHHYRTHRVHCIRTNWASTLPLGLQWLVHNRTDWLWVDIITLSLTVSRHHHSVTDFESASSLCHWLWVDIITLSLTVSQHHHSVTEFESTSSLCHWLWVEIITLSLTVSQHHHSVTGCESTSSPCGTPGVGCH